MTKQEKFLNLERIAKLFRNSENEIEAEYFPLLQTELLPQLESIPTVHP
ncbi:hypothetical protein LEP1GSC127_3676 [Leptospira kirschneri str. 200801925]|nr:hypothetical protein LEP1GSC127_3676 [Leptospira kirschneri str. 200801925]